MKTTLEIPDDLYRRIKALAALDGRTVKDLVNEILRKTVDAERASGEMCGWRSAFGKAPRAAIDSVQAVVDAELSRIDGEDWR